jgi:serine/threonine-protein kinase
VVATAAVPVSPGRLRFAVTPWGEIHVDGKRLGVTPPLTELKLAAGKHVVEIRNTTFAPHRETVELAAGATLRIKHRFQ